MTTTPREARGWVERALEEVLTLTCWIDCGVQPGPPLTVTIAFSGRHRDCDRFRQHQAVTGDRPVWAAKLWFIALHRGRRAEGCSG